ncbi:MAG: hypothetical protein ACRD1V_15850 [Vicinamibacterales bacterium]
MKLATSSRLLLALAAIFELGSCGMGTKLQPPTASIQQLQVQPDGSWQVILRVENFSYDTGMHVYSVDADLTVGDKSAGHIAVSPGLDIPEMTADTTIATLMPNATARAVLAATRGSGPARNAVSYELKGNMSVGKGETGKADRFDLDGKGYLSPVPGVANLWR